MKTENVSYKIVDERRKKVRNGEYMMINYQALRYFEVVARYEHFTKAANELYISQSTLSKAIDGLEHDIGVKLFEKQGRNMKLTLFGKILRDYVQKGSKEIENGIRVVQGMSNEQSGTVRIATIYSAGSFLLPQYIKGFSDKNPNIKFRYYQKPTYMILDDILNGELDLGFCSNYDETEEYGCLCKELIRTEELCLIVPKDHSLAQRTEVDFEEVRAENWIGYNGDTGIATAIMDILRAVGLSKKIHFSYFASEDSSIVGLVRAGLGISLIPINSSVPMDGIVKIRITKPFFYRNIYMVWNKDRYLSPVATKFRKYILTVA